MSPAARPEYRLADVLEDRLTPSQTLDFSYYTSYTSVVALEVSNEPGSNPHDLTDDQLRVAMMDGRLNRHSAGQAIPGFQLYESWGYTFHPSNPTSFLTMLVFVIYTETPSGDRFVHYARRATREEESEHG